MCLVLENSVGPAYFETGGLCKTGSHIFLQVAALAHSLVVRLLHIGAELVLVDLEGGDIRIHAGDSPGIRPGDALLTCMKPVGMGQAHRRKQTFHAVWPPFLAL